jgi:EAL domain-containing protein (putative c-di-GMP-specific phosphodiesterase class I)
MTSHKQEALTRVLEDDKLVLFYQPIHEVQTRRIVSAEALLRECRESGEIREAGIITAAAEEGPNLFRFDSWAMHRAFSDAAAWQSELAPEVRLNANLSPREFQEGNVVTRVAKLIDDAKVDASRLNLEITETSYIDDPEETMHTLRDLKQLGMELWLDDFGTGHSSITHLQLFPLDGVKLPGSFVKPIVEDRRSRIIVASIIKLAHDLGLRVIAEEVERQDQLEIIEELGCDYIQGFYFSKPTDVATFRQLLASERS